MACEAETERVGEAHVVEVEDVLHNVVAERVLDQLKAVGGDLTHKMNLLIAGSMVDTALKNATSVAVRTDGYAVLANSIKDELGIFCLEVVQALLDHVVAVEILNERDYVATQSVDDDLDLLRRRNEFNHLLQSAGTVLVECDGDQGWSGIAHEGSALLTAAELQKLLAEVVAKRVCRN